jgi:hypothetical protein
MDSRCRRCWGVEGVEEVMDNARRAIEANAIGSWCWFPAAVDVGGLGIMPEGRSSDRKRFLVMVSRRIRYWGVGKLWIARRAIEAIAVGFVGAGFPPPSMLGSNWVFRARFLTL